ncbi:hypothetical protein Nepgr_026036 [Nepenthes gracilis]|uniref:Uncharacterized protein n=1 Tax=Nepenthes gracilis TaxID=150966 RepID=A0AAD3Y083_NEPGR|nr:hypothetical protein Nepgr_026036 [Nepenthes gracilis]
MPPRPREGTFGGTRTWTMARAGLKCITSVLGHNEGIRTRTLDYGPVCRVKALPPAQEHNEGYGFRLWGSTQPVPDVVPLRPVLKII